MLSSPYIASLTELQRYSEMSSKAQQARLNITAVAKDLQYFTFEGYKDKAFLEGIGKAELAPWQRQLEGLQVQLKELTDQSPTYAHEFRELVGLMSQLKHRTDTLMISLRKRGFKDWGLEGKLRAAIHRVENSTFPYDRVSMLTLRRHEKDFFLRKDLKYVVEFDTAVSILRKAVMKQSANVYGAETLLKDLMLYRAYFHETVAEEKLIGLSGESGLRKSIKGDLDTLVEKIEKLNVQVQEQSASLRQAAIKFIITLAIVQFVLGILLAIVFASLITNTFKQLKQALGTLSKGTFPTPLKATTRDEIGDIKRSFNLLLERLHAAVAFLSEMKKGNYDAEYAADFRQDILGQSLTATQEELRRSSSLEKHVNWTNAGLAKLSAIFEADSNSLSNVCDTILRFVTPYIGAAQSSLYLIDNDAKCLTIEATFARGDGKAVGQKLDLSHGMLGQCIADRTMVNLNNLPQNYAKISSGLGEAAPSGLAIVPLKQNNTVVGAIEVTSLENFTAPQLEFLEKAGERIASIVATFKHRESTDKLIAELNARTKQLITREEELRQNSEELLSTIEQLDRERQHYLDRLDEDYMKRLGKTNGKVEKETDLTSVSIL